MSDYTDMILDGTLNEDGSYQGGNENGLPSWATEEKDDSSRIAKNKMFCPICGKRIKKKGEKDHMQKKHPGEPS
jgi:hypothetical protein